MATSKAKKSHHLIRVTKEIFNDLMILKMFIENFNGTLFILNDNGCQTLILSYSLIVPVAG